MGLMQLQWLTTINPNVFFFNTNTYVINRNMHRYCTVSRHGGGL